MMGTESKYRIFTVLFLLFAVSSYKGQAQYGSIYMSAGNNMSWFSPSNIHIEQENIGNSYNMVKVKGTDKTKDPFSPAMLSYRLGIFYNEFQTNGIELAFDPVYYSISDNQNIVVKGTLNNIMGISKTIPFSSATGSYYKFSGCNFISVNMVKRIPIYMDNRKNIDIAAIVKGGGGPAFPKFASSLPINPEADPRFKMAGWNLSAEGGVRVRLYRFAFFDLTARYAYASFDALNIYEGTARQSLTYYQVIGSFGIIFPTTKMNPLFHREHKIVTILPFYQHKDEVGKTIKKRKGDGDGADSLGNERLDSIPEFQEIVDKKYRREHPDTVKPVPLDSLGNPILKDSLGNPIITDSIKADQSMNQDNAGKDNAVQDTTEHLSKRELKKKRKAEKKAKKEEEKRAKEAEQEKAKEQEQATEQKPEEKKPEEKPEEKKPEEKPEEKKDK